MNRTIGKCSICGGAVTVVKMWRGINPPVPTCSKCGAVAADSGPVIPMKPVQPRDRYQWSAEALARMNYPRQTVRVNFPDDGEKYDGILA